MLVVKYIKLGYLQLAEISADWHFVYSSLKSRSLMSAVFFCSFGNWDVYDSNQPMSTSNMLSMMPSSCTIHFTSLPCYVRIC